jgi:hypothetical protein
MQRQNSRVNTIVEYAREHSRFYREKYQHVHFPIENIQQLPHVSKPELMASFNDWVTDPAIKREDVEAFAADKSKPADPSRSGIKPGEQPDASTDGAAGNIFPGRAYLDDPGRRIAAGGPWRPGGSAETKEGSAYRV